MEGFKNGVWSIEESISVLSWAVFRYTGRQRCLKRMSSYKVIQDIEAEDKLVGPLTLRQFIYAGVAAVCLYICFLAFTKHAVFLIVFFLPIAAVTGFFAFPWKGEQPTEIWALARLRFMIKPRVRVWDQSGVKDVVTITAPRKLENIRPLTNNLSENEVRSRLKALADTIDSRGWATRNASYSAYMAQRNSPNSQMVQPNAAGMVGLLPSDDMFDERSSVAQNFDAMLTKSSQNQRQRVMQQMAQASMPSMPQSQQQQAQPPQQAPVQWQAMPYQQPSVPIAPQQAADYQQQVVQQYAPQPMTAAAPAPPVNYQSPQLPAPVMPSAPLPSAVPPVPGDYWFNNGPAYPGDQQAQNSQNVLASPSLSEPFAAALSSGKIMTDVPIAAAAVPNAEELAFAEAVKAQNLATQKINYAHMRVLQPVDINGQTLGPTPSLAPSVPGMIDYGRPQPVDDQMQYDTSSPQSNTTSASSRHSSGPSSITGEPVTRKPDPAILELANNDDLDVATIARQASKEMKKSPDEVEIRLH